MCRGRGDRAQVYVCDVCPKRQRTRTHRIVLCLRPRSTTRSSTSTCFMWSGMGAVGRCSVSWTITRYEVVKGETADKYIKLIEKKWARWPGHMRVHVG